MLGLMSSWVVDNANVRDIRLVIYVIGLVVYAMLRLMVPIMRECRYQCSEGRLWLLVWLVYLALCMKLEYNICLHVASSVSHRHRVVYMSYNTCLHIFCACREK